jgi:Secretion system C-terminal sorting domain
MKNYTKLVLAFAIGCINLGNAATPVASIVLSNPAVSNKITHYTDNNSAAEAYTIQTTKDGVQCREIPTSKYAYFRVDDTTILPTDSSLLFYITFYDEGTNTFNLQYNSNDSSGTNSNYNYKSSVITKTGSNTWITVTIAIPNASFRNAQNNSSDFRISGGTNVFISKIEIAKGGLNPDAEPIPVVTGSSYSEFMGKSVAGYQAWFKTGNATSGWTHWSGNTPPATNKTHFEIYPDVTEYLDTDLAQTALANLGNGTASKLFNSTNKTVIETHFKWMKDYGIDGAAVQRFIGNIGGAIINSPNSAATKIKEAAEANGRIFYICYDTSSSGMEATWDDIIKFDWVYNVEQNNNLTASPAYAKVGNKPVVQLWGTGMAGGKNPGTAAETIALIQFLQSRGCYVIGGLPRSWRAGNKDSKGLAQTSTLPGDQENFEPVYSAYDMISPWMVGRIRTNADSDGMVSTMTGDKSYCDTRSIDYMPVIFPGFAWSQWNNGDVNWAPRNAGDFMWRQAYNIKNVGVSNMYFAMFDEYDEGTAIMKNATDWTMIPTDQYFLTSSADGIWCSSDFQLRVAGASVEMLKGTRATTTTVPIPHSLGPVYYRNSFEKRTTAYNYVNDVATKTGTFNLDPCFYKEAVLTNSNVVNPYCDIQQLNVKSGLYSVKASGTISSSLSAIYSKRISEVKIPVTKDMKLSFWKKTENDLGRYVFVDLITNTGKKLSAYSYTDQNGNLMNAATAHGTVGAGWEKFTCDFGKDILLGETIVGIQINYEQTAIGSFEAYFDDFLIEEAKTLGETTLEKIVENPFKINQNPSMGEFIIENTTGQECIFAVCNLTGQMLLNKKSNESNERIDLTVNPDGIYLLQVIYNGNSYIQKLIKN